MMTFITGLVAVIFVNIILSGDNAVVIAMACRNLEGSVKDKAVRYGSVGAIVLRVALTFVAVKLMEVPYFNLAGGLMLLWIAIGLLKGEDDKEIKGGHGLASAIKTIIIADLVMSLDNVVAVAGTAHGNIWLIIIGLVVSIPVIIWCSKLLMKLMNRFPIIVTIGSALLGYTAGEMILDDKAVGNAIGFSFFMGFTFIPFLLAIAVVVIGKFLGRKSHVEVEA